MSDELKMSWWWSRDEERFHGPCSDRADAIMEAWADDPEQGAFICQAAQGGWRTSIIDPDHLEEWFDDANEEHADPDADHPSSVLSKDAWKALATELNRQIYVAIRKTGVLAWAFVRQSTSEYVDIPTMWVAAQAALSSPSSGEGG